jgi:hypothetical protein
VNRRAYTCLIVRPVFRAASAGGSVRTNSSSAAVHARPSGSFPVARPRAAAAWRARIAGGGPTPHSRRHLLTVCRVTPQARATAWAASRRTALARPPYTIGAGRPDSPRVRPTDHGTGAAVSPVTIVLRPRASLNKTAPTRTLGAR